MRTIVSCEGGNISRWLAFGHMELFGHNGAHWQSQEIECLEGQ
jgi:hypothetical protein